jgi:glycosyltransferase involved in cell wall biosynthesis
MFPGSEMVSAVALLGRVDSPTDGVQDYCTFLGEALRRHGIEMSQASVPWFAKGWIGALRQLSWESADWRGRRVLLQYTALAWSRRGFPWGPLAAVAILRRKGARVTIVFHDTIPFGGTGLYDRVRTRFQIWVMRRLALLSDQAVSVLPIERMPWAQSDSLRRKFLTIPIGANIPEPDLGERGPSAPASDGLTLVIFGVTARDRGTLLGEVSDIAYAVRRAAQSASRFRLIVLGRGSSEAELSLKKELHNLDIEVSVLGLLPADRIAAILAAADAMLFVRGYISGRRGTAIAGIVCGLPIVAYAGSETDFPLTEAGLELAPEGDRDALASALARVMTENDFRQELRRRSVRARTEYFSWSKIAQQFAVGVFKT